MATDVPSIEATQNRLLEEVGTAVLSDSLKRTETEAAALMRLLESVPLPEGSGDNVDLLA